MKTHSFIGSMKTRRLAGPKGLALVVTLSLMILLTIVAVAMLSLGSISLRASSQTPHLAAARSNARMALALAIGEIQKLSGPDTRVTARADLLDENNPLVTGVWKSWEGTDHEISGSAAGRPISSSSSFPSAIPGAPPPGTSSRASRTACWSASPS